MKADNMQKRWKKHQRAWLIGLIIICLGVILFGGIHYVERLRENLGEQAVQNVLAVTKQQRQAFDTFIAGDRERLRSFAEYFSDNPHESPEDVRKMLKLFNEVDATYAVFCLDEGWYCINASNSIHYLSEDELEIYLPLKGSGVRDTFTSIFSGEPKFGIYESFNFANGHRGFIQKSYDRSKVSETFSLSFYDNKGLAYVVNRKGDILLRSVGMIGDTYYDNIFQILNGNYGDQAAIDAFAKAMQSEEEGSMTFTGERGSFVYTYVPVETVDEWYLVSIVPETAINAEADEILMQSRQAVVLLILILLVCAIFLVLMWRTHKELKNRDEAIEYQDRMFEIFATYLSRNTDDVYMLLDIGGHQIEYLSPNAERVFGIDDSEVLPNLGATVLDNVTGDQVRLDDLYKLELGEKAETLEGQWTNPSTGEQKWFLHNVYCTQLQGRKKLVFYISDRTKERRAQERLAEALRMAQAANEAKSAFLSNVSHDIRTPMNAIIGFLALMRNEADNPGMVQEYAQRIDAASQHLLGLINDVLDMNKIESGSATLNLSEMNLAEVIDEINTIIRPQAKARNQTFEIFVSPLNYEHLMGDKLRINQILINLLSNAVKYTPKEGYIEMRVEELPRVVENYSRIRFTVKDNGLGMSEEYQKVIFNPFTREETEITHKIQGTGLGMAITKSLVDLMGGTIHVDSKLGEGSTFTVELELYIQEKEDDPKFWNEYSVSRMIVADDDEEVCQTIVKIMGKTGVTVDYATSGGTAIQMMRQNREAGRPYDLILLDWKMPDLDGLETARLIRKNYPEKIPILLLTAYDWGEIEQEAIEIGVSHFMPKPFFMCTFKEAIRRVMGSQKENTMGDAAIVQGKHFLVVDDIEVNQIILVKILSTLGASCEVASNGQEAVDKFEASEPGGYDLILMDVQMPVMDGYEATRTIRSSSHPSAKTVPIVAMTANAFVDDVRDAIDSGMNAHIAKPVQLDKLKSTIQQVLEERPAAET